MTTKTINPAEPLKLRSNKVASILKAYSKHFVALTLQAYPDEEYNFSEHITHNLGAGNEQAYENGLAALLAADDFEQVLKKAGKISKYRELSDYDDDQLRDFADDLLHFEGVDKLENAEG